MHFLRKYLTGNALRLRKREVKPMYYVYILKSDTEDRRYVGYTSDLRARLKDHNNGKVASTKPRCPYTIESYMAVQEKKTALELERYFKTGSGIAWMKKRLLSDIRN